jgi:alpha-1,2-mannosyltransferase
VVILAAPSWFHYYCDYLAVALALAVAGAAGSTAHRPTAARRVVDWLPVAAVAAVTGLILGLGAAVLHPFRGAAQLTRAVAAQRCVMTDSPIAQIELDALSRGLANGCPNWVDVTGLTYGPDRPQYPGQPRIDNAQWQGDLLRYLRSGNAVILVRHATLSAHARAVIHHGGVLARAGGHIVYRVKA